MSSRATKGPEELRKSLSQLKKGHSKGAVKQVDTAEIVDAEVALELAEKVTKTMLVKLALPLMVDADQGGQMQLRQHFEEGPLAVAVNEEYLNTLHLDTSVQLKHETRTEMENLIGVALSEMLEEKEIEVGGEEVQEMTKPLVDTVVASLQENWEHGVTVTGTIREGEADALKERIMQAWDESDRAISAAYEEERAKMNEAVNVLEELLKKTTEIVTKQTDEVNEQLAHYDEVETERINKMKQSYKKIEGELKKLQKIEEQLVKLAEADEKLIDEDGGSDLEDLEDVDADDEDDEEAESVAGSKRDMSTLSADEIERKITQQNKRKARINATLRDLVLQAFNTTRGGSVSKDHSADKSDLKDLEKLKLGSNNKDTREKINGKKMCELHKAAMLKKPDAYVALGPMFAVYMEVNVSLSSFELGTLTRVASYIDSREFDNPWGMGYLTMARFGDEVKELYELQVAAVSTLMIHSTGPDHNFDPSTRNKKVQVRGVVQDAASYIEKWKTQQEYQSPRRMEEQRSEVLEIRKLFYKMPLEKALPAAMSIVRNAVLLDAKVSWLQTGARWVEIVGALHRDLKSDLQAHETGKCPDGISEWDCISCLEPLLADIQAHAATVANLLSDAPSNLPNSHELHLAVDEHEVLALTTAAARYSPGATHQKNSKQSNGNKGQGAAQCQVSVQGERCSRKLNEFEMKLHAERAKKSKNYKGKGKAPKNPYCCHKHFESLRKWDGKHFGKEMKWQDGNVVKPFDVCVFKENTIKVAEEEEQSAAEQAAAAEEVESPAPSPAAAPAPAPETGMAAWMNQQNDNMSRLMEAMTQLQAQVLVNDESLRSELAAVKSRRAEQVGSAQEDLAEQVRLLREMRKQEMQQERQQPQKAVEFKFGGASQ